MREFLHIGIQYMCNQSPIHVPQIWNKDLELVHELPEAHESYIYTLAISRTGRLYSSSADGTIRYFDKPLTSAGPGTILMRTRYDEITALFCSSADDAVVWSGDDHGAVIKWVNGRIAFKYNLVEEVRSMWVENTWLYTARDLDAVITDTGTSKTGQYMTIGTIAGRAPLTLCGPMRTSRQTVAALATADGGTGGRTEQVQRRQFLAFTTRDGRGLQLVRNERRFETVWTREETHEMIINAICGNERELFTAGYDGHVKRWTELEAAEPLNVGDARIGHCVNAICEGADGVVYVADTRGMISRVGFSGVAA